MTDPLDIPAEEAALETEDAPETVAPDVLEAEPETPEPDVPAIVARDLVKRFGRQTVAVDGVSITVPRGEIFGLLGPDGAGKSTLIRMLATVLRPTEGDAEIFGESVTRHAGRVKPRVGYMSQRFSLYPDLTVAENLRFFAELRGVPRNQMRARSDRLLEFSGLTRFSTRRAEHLSGGMKQKLALAVTLMHEPDMLFLDEPTTGVDPVSRREFWRIIADLHRRGITVFVATPYMDEAERCTTVAFMDGGQHSPARHTAGAQVARAGTAHRDRNCRRAWGTRCRSLASGHHQRDRARRSRAYPRRGPLGRAGTLRRGRARCRHRRTQRPGRTHRHGGHVRASGRGGAAS